MTVGSDDHIVDLLLFIGVALGFAGVIAVVLVASALAVTAGDIHTAQHLSQPEAFDTHRVEFE